MEGSQQPVQVLVDRASGWIVAYGSFPDGTSDPSQDVVTLPPDQVPMLDQPGQKVWNPGTQTITIAELAKPVAPYAAREREENETILNYATDDTTKIGALTRLTLGV